MQELLGIQGSMGAGEWRSFSDKAQVSASFLRCHPSVSEVRYPGLTSDSDYRQASSTLRGGFGPLVRFRVDAGLSASSASASRLPGTWLQLDVRYTEADAFELVSILESFLK